MTADPTFAKGRAITNAFDNGDRARHRWYPIKEGFSPSLVSDSYEQLQAAGPRKVLAVEPFSGSGTTPVECARLGVTCMGFEVNPFLAFVGRTKLKQVDPSTFNRVRKHVLKGLGKPLKSHLEQVSTFCESKERKKWLFNREVLRTFAGGWESIKNSAPCHRALFRLALLRATMDNCNAYPDGKCLRYKRLDSYKEFNADNVTNQFEKYCDLIAEDLESTPLIGSASTIECMDSRNLGSFRPLKKFDLCITSPPYLNSFDYSDVYRPELFLSSFVSNNDDLMKIRLQTVRSHVQASWKSPAKSSFGTMYAEVMKELLTREEQLWSKRIPEMIQAYFEDMERLLSTLSRRANPGALLKIAVGTSAYAGIVIPVDFILAEIGEKVGWELVDIEVIRRLRSSAQLWKHEDKDQKVPQLRESVVILKSPILKVKSKK